MANLFSYKNPKEILTNYFGLLSKVGYAKQSTVFRMLIYIFLLDFLKYCANYITEQDYALIRACLILLYKNGDCLFSYPAFCQNRLTLGTERYNGDISFLLKEDGMFTLMETDKTVLTEDLTEG